MSFDQFVATRKQVPNGFTYQDPRNLKEIVKISVTFDGYFDADICGAYDTLAKTEQQTYEFIMRQ